MGSWTVGSWQLAVGQLDSWTKDFGMKKVIRKEDEEMLRELQRMRERLLQENRALEALIEKLGKERKTVGRQDGLSRAK